MRMRNLSVTTTRCVHGTIQTEKAETVSLNRGFGTVNPARCRITDCLHQKGSPEPTGVSSPPASTTTTTTKHKAQHYC